MSKNSITEPVIESAVPKAVILIMNQENNISAVQPQAGNQKSVTESAAKVLSGGMNQADNSKNTAGTVNTAHEDDNTIVVQYNPKSIQYSASAQDTQTNAAAGTGGPNAITAGCSTTMSIELLFHTLGQEDDSVRKQMNKFLTLMSKSKDRQVRFSWSSLVMEGAVTSFTSSYDMFDSKGKPISAKVNLSIRSRSGAEEKQYEKLIKERSNKKIV